MYSTSYKKWSKVVTFDAIIASAFVAGLFYSVPYVLPLVQFFMWMLILLGFVLNTFLLSITLVGENAIEDTNYPAEKRKSIEEKLNKLWNGTITNALAYSKTFFWYQWLSGLGIMSMQVIAGFYVMACFSMFNSFVMSLLVANARKRFDKQKST